MLEKLPQAKLIIVPRHPERFDEVEHLIQESGFSFARRSQPDTWRESTDVLLGDSMGELMLAYQLSDVAFVAGSLVPIGGHNVIEPAMLGKPVLSGPYVHNFQEIFHELESQGGALQASTDGEISELVVDLLENENRRNAVGSNAKKVVEKSRGALKRTVKELEPFL